MTEPATRTTPTAVDVYEYTPSDLQFAHDPLVDGFMHQYDRDIHLFVLWDRAREHEAEILKMLSDEFKILAEFEVRWSQEHIRMNFERLYGIRLRGESTKPESVGAGPFLLVVVEDAAPVYRYRQNVSGFLELTNVRVAATKKAARAQAGGYTVHSSNDIREFFRDGALILGPDRLDRVLLHDPDAGPLERTVVTDDLIGADGWHDFDELVAVLRRTTEYVVLRSFEGLPDILEDDPEIDVMARNPIDFVAIVNGRGDYTLSQGSQFRTRVGGSTVIFDTRWVGDGYLDSLWQNDVLHRRTWTPTGVAIPRSDDHFFSLLYHAKVQKPKVKAAYHPRLRALALDLDLPSELASKATEDAAAAALLDGFLRANGYSVPQTVDRTVYRNQTFLTQLAMSRVEPSAIERARSQAWERVRYTRLGERAASYPQLRAAMRKVRGLARRAGGVL